MLDSSHLVSKLRKLCICRVSCGRYRPFTCESACGLLATDTSGAEQLPANVTCTSTGKLIESQRSESAACEYFSFYQEQLLKVPSFGLEDHCTVQNLSNPAADNHEVGIMGVAAGWLQHRSSGSSKSLGSHAKATNRVLDAKASQLWSKVWEASSHAANAEFRLPESRTVNRDWVRDGVHIPRWHPNSPRDLDEPGIESRYFKNPFALTMLTGRQT